MRWACLLAVLAFGCEADDRGPGSPGGGGNGGGGDGDRDAGGDGVKETPITGSVCQIVDFRAPDNCANVNLSGVEIAARDGGTATASADGTFSLARPSASTAILEITGAAHRRSIVEIPLPDGGAGDVALPLVSTATMDELLAALEVIEPDGTGTLAIYVREDGDPQRGAEIIPPEGAFAPFYDAGGPLDWDQLGATGAAGAALVFGTTAPGDATFTVITGSEIVDLTAPVLEAAVTFVVVDL
jgi:hypothetical protein